MDVEMTNGEEDYVIDVGKFMEGSDVNELTYFSFDCDVDVDEMWHAGSILWSNCFEKWSLIICARSIIECSYNPIYFSVKNMKVYWNIISINIKERVDKIGWRNDRGVSTMK